MREGGNHPHFFEVPRSRTLSRFFNLCLNLSRGGELSEDGYVENEFYRPENRSFTVRRQLRISKRKLIKSPIVSVIIEELPENQEYTGSILIKKLDLYRNRFITSSIYLEIDGENKKVSHEPIEKKVGEVSEYELREIASEMQEISNELYKTD